MDQLLIAIMLEAQFRLEWLIPSNQEHMAEVYHRYVFFYMRYV